MKKFKKIVFSPAGTIAMFVMAAVLLLTSSIGGARAALTYYSDTYTSQLQMYDIGVTLQENWKPGEDGTQAPDWHDISWRYYDDDGRWEENSGALLTQMIPDKDGDGKPDESLVIGKKYDEELRVANSGTINEFVRVSIYKYWMQKTGVDEDGNEIWEKVRSVSQRDENTSPDNIILGLLCDATGVDNGWLLDESSTTDERVVLYYNKAIYAPANAEQGPVETPIFCNSIQISPNIIWKVTETRTEADGGRVNIVTTYDYDGYKFVLDVKVDAIQEHNIETAVKSAWGLDVNVNTTRSGEKVLSLVKDASPESTAADQ